MKIPVIKNTVTNYLNAGVRLLQGILISRWIIGYLGMEYYGLWTLLWSFFVYALLLDFGCGVSAQKYTSGGLYEKDPGKYSRVLSTIFTFHSAMALIIALLTFLFSFFLSGLLDIHDPEKLEYARKCFLLFGFGAALLFPTGMFPEILVGEQKIYLRNYIIIVAKVIELIGILVIFSLGAALIPLIVFSMLVSLGTNLTMGGCILKLHPKLKLRLKWDRECWKEIAVFSGFVYLGSIAKLVLNRSSRLLISIFCGVASVGVFHLSSKIADLSLIAVSQYQENISPISGALYKRGKYSVLGRIILGSMRWNSFTAFGVMMIAYMLAEPLLWILFKVRDPEVTSLSRLFLISYYLSTAVRDVPHSFFVMTERHRFATGVIIAEAAANLILNLLLLKPFGMRVVIWNGLIIKIIIAAVIILPYLLRCIRIPAGEFLGKIFLQPFLAGIPAVLYLLLMTRCLHLDGWLLVIFGGTGAGMIYLFLISFFVPRSQKKRYLNKILPGFLRKT